MEFRPQWIWVGIVLVLILGAQTGEAQQENNLFAVETLDTSVQCLTRDRVYFSCVNRLDEVEIVLPYISGGIFGNPNNTPVFRKRLSGDYSFSIHTDDFIRRVDRGASILEDFWYAKGLSMRPNTTKIARIGTFAYNTVTNTAAGSGSFMDKESQDNLILIYVDNKCQVSGSVTLHGKQYIHDIEFPSEGFHWIRAIQINEDKFKLEYFVPKQEVFFALVM